MKNKYINVLYLCLQVQHFSSHLLIIIINIYFILLEL
jgi:hypothetical protein